MDTPKPKKIRLDKKVKLFTKVLHQLIWDQYQYQDLKIQYLQSFYLALLKEQKNLDGLADTRNLFKLEKS